MMMMIEGFFKNGG